MGDKNPKKEKKVEKQVITQPVETIPVKKPK